MTARSHVVNQILSAIEGVNELVPEARKNIAPAAK